jgi:hypothetical protein
MQGTTERAPGLSDRAEFVLRHCGQPMLWHGSQTSWTGKPGMGTERHHTRFVCGVCGARVSIELEEMA